MILTQYFNTTSFDAVLIQIFLLLLFCFFCSLYINSEGLFSVFEVILTKRFDVIILFLLLLLMGIRNHFFFLDFMDFMIQCT